MPVSSAIPPATRLSAAPSRPAPAPARGLRPASVLSISAAASAADPPCPAALAAAAPRPAATGSRCPAPPPHTAAPTQPAAPGTAYQPHNQHPPAQRRTAGPDPAPPGSDRARFRARSGTPPPRAPRSYPGVVDDPGHHGLLAGHGRQHLPGDGVQQGLVAPGRLGHQMMQGLPCGLHAVRSQPGSHRFNRLARRARAGRGSSPSGEFPGPDAPRPWPSPPDRPRSASPASLAPKGRFVHNNSTINCFVCDPVVLGGR